MKTQPLMIWIPVFVVLVASCGPPTPEALPTSPPASATPAPPTRTPEPKPTATPTEPFSFPTEADELVGIWTNPAVSTHRFTADGKLEYAHSVEGLADPLAVDKYWIENQQLYLQELSVNGVFPCGKGGVATYEVKLLESGRMKLRAIDEMCNTREGATEGLYDPVK